MTGSTEAGAEAFKLQWGRVVIDAESRGASCRRGRSCGRLQWGRVVIDAESDPSGSLAPGETGSFNGAAS